MIDWQPISPDAKNGEWCLLWLSTPYDRCEVAWWYEPWRVWLLRTYVPEPNDERCGIGELVPSHWASINPPVGVK